MPIMKKMTMMTKNKKMIIMEMILAMMKMKKMIMELKILIKICAYKLDFIISYCSYNRELHYTCAI